MKMYAKKERKIKTGNLQYAAGWIVAIICSKVPNMPNKYE